MNFMTSSFSITTALHFLLSEIYADISSSGEFDPATLAEKNSKLEDAR